MAPPRTFNIPDSIEAASEFLVGLDAVVTAREWQRAAIVSAFVDLADKDGGRKPATSSRLSPNEFAARGIIGLRSKDTVRKYVEAWESTGRDRPIPGQQIELPTDPWPPTSGNTVTDYVTEPRLREAIASNPRIREAAKEAVAEAEQFDYEAGVVARGGKVTTLADVNAGAGSAPLDAVFDRNQKHMELFRTLERAAEIVADLDGIDDDSMAEVTRLIALILDYAPGAVPVRR